MADADADEGIECPGPHRQCQACTGSRIEVRETLYVSSDGRGQGVAAPHRCWHCKGRGYYCTATPRCHPAHE
ncbi:hypothetical protein E1265_21820 [Streptomyces sp. 8K308]|uniref:hypothetical protein n=1 Tax=Streptomyces sp. 8K308 TaxID=2530388 RepID=UPI001048B8A9|nr:hypothetical protein [Streptomyces sp. 8K308]TDC20521.1 hypothetical protein E1265_21820 [Streptomyces sp. 8K308]